MSNKGTVFNPYCNGELIDDVIGRENEGGGSSCSGGLIASYGEFQFNHMIRSAACQYLWSGVVLTYCNPYEEISVLAFPDKRISAEEAGLFSIAKCWSLICKHVPAYVMMRYITNIGKEAYAKGCRDGADELRSDFNKLLGLNETL